MSRALGRYELVRPLARGGMAEVYLARRRAAGVEKWLVVKRMRPERSRDARFLDLFVREARLSMSLAHQNIVPVFDFGRIDDQVFLAMERVEGKDLGSSLAHGGRDHPMPALLAAFVAAECCQALDYAHHRKSPEGAALGIVHRDVTPRNVMLSWSGEVKLTDFGIAALAGDETTRLIGTPAYMAPEQARGEPIDARADVYAIGLVLREAMTGERARPGGERDAILAAARKGELLPWPAGASGPLVAVVDRATAAEPEKRYPDASSMLADLDELIVAERAGKKGDAPDRQLAAWLMLVWGTEAETRDSQEIAIPGEHLVSFLDDGALDVIGTGTERSMAATADESIVVQTPVSSAKLDAAPPAPQTTEAPRKRTWLAIAGAAAVIGAAGISFAVVSLRGGRDDTAPAPPAASVAKAEAVAPHPASPATGATGPKGSDGSTSPATGPTETHPETGSATKSGSAAEHDKPIKRPASGSADAKRPATTTDGGAKPAVKQPDPKAGSAAKPVDVVLRRVTINIRPGWANFTVDNDPTPHQTVEVVTLPPGPHRIHFTNPQRHLDRMVTIDVAADRDTSYIEQIE